MQPGRSFIDDTDKFEGGEERTHSFGSNGAGATTGGYLFCRKM